jgi:hypothetical protein
VGDTRTRLETYADDWVGIAVEALGWLAALGFMFITLNNWDMNDPVFRDQVTFGEAFTDALPTLLTGAALIALGRITRYIRAIAELAAEQ